MLAMEERTRMALNRLRQDDHAKEIANRPRHLAIHRVYCDFALGLQAEVQRRLYERHRPDGEARYHAEHGEALAELFPTEAAQIRAMLIEEFVAGFEDDVAYRMAIDERDHRRRNAKHRH